MSRDLIRLLFCIPVGALSIMMLASALFGLALAQSNEHPEGVVSSVVVAIFTVILAWGCWRAAKSAWGAKNKSGVSHPSRRLRTAGYDYAVVSVGHDGPWEAVKRWLVRSQLLSRKGVVANISMRSDDPVCRQISVITAQHISTLAMEKRSKLAPDKYGIVDEEKWRRELMGFVDRVAIPHVHSSVGRRQLRRSVSRLSRGLVRRNSGLHDDGLLRIVACALVDNSVNEHEASSRSSLPCRTVFSPGDFEEWCAEELRAAGWDARVSGQSGDQGVDVYAEREGVSLALQCKLYSQPVGNKAVQEVYAGKAFCRAHHAAVVSTCGYTQSARAIANETGVHLLSPEQVRDFSPRQAWTSGAA